MVEGLEDTDASFAFRVPGELPLAPTATLSPLYDS